MFMQNFYGSILAYLQGKKNVGIFISGGFDSTILLYILCKIIANEGLDIAVKVFTVPRYDDSTVHADRVLVWIRSIFNSIEFVVEHIGDPDLHHSKQVLSGIQAVRVKLPELSILLADTSIPLELQTPDAPQRVKSHNSLIIQPFIDYDKRTTVTLAEEMGKLDEIARISHTCTQSKLWRCSNCWQCYERAWAFKSLGLNDCGKM